ncbi:MAG: 2Fe-2S iron-sulfur cluster-binding protein [Byssovorax sp.]
MFRRSRPLRDPVEITLDGEAIPAERGESLALALLAADKTILARSPKLHRPRGPSCMRGGCDGCLCRVDGAPNVMACQHAVRGGEEVVSQNVVGSRKADLLRVTDWFFSKGIDHHHLMAGVPGLSEVMVSFARKVAGLGRLPSEAQPALPARRAEVDVVVVGGGAAGMGAAARLAAAHRSVILVDDGLELGGSLGGAKRKAAPLLSAFPRKSVEVLLGSVAAGYFFGDVLISTDAGAVVARPRAVVFATGAHDGVLAVPGNDMPGIFSARAFCRVLAAGIEPDGPVAIIGEGFWADEVERGLVGWEHFRARAEDVVAVHGTAGVSKLELSEDGKTKKVPVSSIALALPGAPAFELCAQAGAEVRFDPARGYVVVVDERGRAAEGIWAAGECTGRDFDPEALWAEGEHVGGDVLGWLS